MTSNPTSSHSIRVNLVYTYKIVRAMLAILLEVDF